MAAAIGHSLRVGPFQTRVDGHWRLFSNGNDGRFLYGFSECDRSQRLQVLVIDTWNECKCVLTAPADESNPVQNMGLYDCYALNFTTLLVLWWNNQSKFLTCSHLCLDFAERTFASQHTVLYKCEKFVDDEHDLIHPTDVSHRFIVRSPGHTRLNYYNAAEMEVDKIATLQLENVSRYKVHVHENRLFLFENPENGFPTRMFRENAPVQPPALHRVDDLSEWKAADKDTDVQLKPVEIPAPNMPNRPQPLQQNWRENVNLMRPVATAFFGTNAYVLTLFTDVAGHPIQFPRRNNRVPHVYKLYRVCLETNTWHEITISPDFFGPLGTLGANEGANFREPLRRPFHRAPWENVVHQLPRVIRTIRRLNRTYEYLHIDPQGHLFLVILKNSDPQAGRYQHYVVDSDLAIESYRSPLMNAEKLSSLAWFCLKDHGLVKPDDLPLNFAPRPLFVERPNERDGGRTEAATQTGGAAGPSGMNGGGDAAPTYVTRATQTDVHPPVRPIIFRDPLFQREDLEYLELAYMEGLLQPVGAPRFPAGPQHFPPPRQNRQ
ncbi:hypothetical protein M3Y99_01543300 [Aphelenchoides fujianensis]|nr:hypothetical protein M3Y99_01543300 [Aphelenchoides fujianensis]